MAEKPVCVCVFGGGKPMHGAPRLMVESGCTCFRPADAAHPKRSPQIKVVIKPYVLPGIAG